MLGDGVDRSHRINTPEYAWQNRRRVAVNQDPDQPGLWDVYRGMRLLRSFPTHAEAIAYADRMARS